MKFFSNINTKVLIAFLTVCASPLFAQGAFGSALQPVTDILIDIACLMQDQWAVAIAVVAIVFLALGAFFGKLNYGTVMVVAVALVFIFGAAIIVVQLATAAGNTAVTAISC